MALSNNYEFTNDICGYSLIKRQICQIRDTSSTFPIDGSASQIYREDQDQFHGTLFKNIHLSYCCCFYCPCFRLSYEVNGFNTKLTEVRIPSACGFCGECAESGFCMMLSGCPEYEVVNPYNIAYGKIKPNCTRCLPACATCAETSATNLTLNTSYLITRDCGPNCCTIRWTIKDRNSGSASANIKFTSCCGFCNSYNLSFMDSISNEDKILLLSTVPFLP